MYYWSAESPGLKNIPETNRIQTGKGDAGPVNLVIIVSDTFRWDYLGAYGNDWIKTPNLDKLAAESVVFMDAYAEGLPTPRASRHFPPGASSRRGATSFPLSTVPRQATWSNSRAGIRFMTRT